MTPFDATLTLWFRAHRYDAFANFMAQSMFDGSGFGGSDLGICLYLAALLAVIVTYRSRRPFFCEINLYSRFMLAMGLGIGIGLVHAVKLSWGRARPELVVDHFAPFSPWYKWGPFLAGRDLFSGSLPSGHTATMLAFVACGYLVWHRGPARLYHGLGGALIALGLLGGVGMAISRAMLLQHWVTDGWIILFGGWFFIHYGFHYFYQIDQQRMALAHLPGGHRGGLLPRRTPWPLLFIVVCSAILLAIRHASRFFL